MIRIALRDSTAEINEGIWSSKDSLLQTQCELFTLQHPWNPDPDYVVAAFVAKKIGAKIIHAEEPDYVDGRVY